jgi:membrane fusion protein, multidrug efflux system
LTASVRLVIVVWTERFSSGAAANECPMNAIGDRPTPTDQPAEVSSAPRRSRRRLIVLPLAVVGLMLAAVTGYWWAVEGRWIESTDDAYVQGDITVLSPRIDGDIAAVPVTDNQRVRAGDPVVQLDDADWRARAKQAEAAVAEAAASVATFKAQIDWQRTNLAAAAADRANAAAERQRTAQDADRSVALRARGWASEQANDLAIAESRKAEAALSAAAAKQVAANDQIAVLTAQLAQAEAKQLGAQAQLTLANNNLDHTVIRAPFDGIVGNRSAQVGKHVVPGTQLLALAPPPEQLYVIANFKETQLRAMREGMTARLVPDIDPDAAVDGVVDSLAPATGALFSLLPPENATGNFTKVVQRVPVKLRIDPEQAKRAAWLRSGLSVTAEVDTRAKTTPRLGLWGTAMAAFAGPSK